MNKEAPKKQVQTGPQTTQVGIVIFGDSLNREWWTEDAKKTHTVIDKGDYLELHPLKK